MSEEIIFEPRNDDMAHKVILARSTFQILLLVNWKEKTIMSIEIFCLFVSAVQLCNQQWPSKTEIKPFQWKANCPKFAILKMSAVRDSGKENCTQSVLTKLFKNSLFRRETGPKRTCLLLPCRQLFGASRGEESWGDPPQSQRRMASAHPELYPFMCVGSSIILMGLPLCKVGVPQKFDPAVQF